ncbi:MAG: hypothetical protein LBK28_03695 [Propionibacteriaceae bacterium]|jgi:hypothetical protein|nr:hypothetical protein [Propionibacteriaceae bacterium]
MGQGKYGLTVTALVGVVSLLLGGCQADAGRSEPLPAESEPPVSVVDFSGTPGGNAVVYASTHTDVPDDFPMVPYWDAVRRGEEFNDALVSDAEIVEWQLAREASLANCMKRKGFLYFPNDRQNSASADESPDDADYYRSRDSLFIPRLPATRAEVQAVGYGVQRKKVAEPVVTDKNQEYIDSLSAKEKSAYSIANVGVDRTAPDYDPYSQPEETGGCFGQMERDFPDPGDTHVEHNILEQHGDIVSEMTVRDRGGIVFGEKPMIKLNREWRTCMAGKDFPIDNLEEGRLWDGPVQAYMLAIRTDPSGKVGIITDDPNATPDEQSRLIGSATERELALLDFDCRTETDYLHRFTEIQRKWEQSFVDANRKALDKMRAFVDGLA